MKEKLSKELELEVLEYMRAEGFYPYLEELSDQHKEEYILIISKTFGFQWYKMGKEFNKLSIEMQKAIEPILKKTLFRGRVK